MLTDLNCTKVKKATNFHRMNPLERFYLDLIVRAPELLDYFSAASMDFLCRHILLVVDLMVQYPAAAAGCHNSEFRTKVDQLGELHRDLGECFCGVGVGCWE